jgi:UDP-N-acetylglucosamine/UDP-N-acetylgalactosamine 4-epimerase
MTYNTKYHNEDISKSRFLITGGAGFIGSNLVQYLLDFNAGHVRVIDDLSNGYYDNIKHFEKYSNFEFIKGDIRDLEVCNQAVENIDYISHQAALGSVPRSIKDPVLTNQVNVDGFLNILLAAKNSNRVKGFVYASSSSVYGNSIKLPKVEGEEGEVLSPYALTKSINDSYASVFSKVYNFSSIGLRYFNVFGPNQNPLNPYAAVIPIFCKNFLDNEPCNIFGDGLTSRDFTYIENVIQANIKGMLFKNLNNHEVINIACGDQINLKDLVDTLNSISNKNIKPKFLPEREGDVKHSNANIEKAKNLIDYSPKINFNKGISLTYKYYEKTYN